MLSGRGLSDELITRPEESYRLWCVVVCDLETSRIGAPYIYIYIYDISSLRVKHWGNEAGRAGDVVGGIFGKCTGGITKNNRRSLRTLCN